MDKLIKQEKQNLMHVYNLYGIEIIFMFGSHAKDRATTKSDFDVGVYLCNRISPVKTWELQCSFMDIYKKCNIDLVILNDASPLLLFDLLINHKVIFMKDERFLYNFFS